MNDTPVKLDSADIIKILELLPHRYPFLLVDRIVDIDGDRSCVGIKNVTFNEPQFTGHFPSRPVFPQQVFFMTIDKAKFRKPVMPGDTVEFHMSKLNQRRNMWWYRGEAKVTGVLVAEAEVSAMLVLD